MALPHVDPEPLVNALHDILGFCSAFCFKWNPNSAKQRNPQHALQRSLRSVRDVRACPDPLARGSGQLRRSLAQLGANPALCQHLETYSPMLYVARAMRCITRSLSKVQWRKGARSAVAPPAWFRCCKESEDSDVMGPVEDGTGGLSPSGLATTTQGCSLQESNPQR